MRSNAPSGCITRVVVDGNHEVELAELQLVMQRIQSALRHIVPPAQHACLGNALLNLAVCRVLRETGAQRTAPACADFSKPLNAANAELPVR